MAAEEIANILRIEVDQKAAAAALAKTEQELTRLRKEQARYRKELKESNGENEEAAKELVKLQKQIRKTTQDRKALIKEIDSEGLTLEELRRRQAALVKQRNKINVSTQEGQKAFNDLNQTIKEYNDVIKNAEQEGGAFQRNVGNYREAIDEALESFEGFGGGVGNAISSLRAFGAAILANPIGIFVAALSTLVGLFSQTESGSRLFRRSIAGLQGVFGVVTGRINQFAEAIGKAFSSENIEKPKTFGQSLLEVGEAALKFVNSFGTAQGLIQTFAESAASGKVAENLEKQKQAFRDVGIELEENIARLQARQQLLASIAGDSTKSLEEQRKANLQSLEVSQQLAAEELELARTRAKFAQQEVDRRRRAGLVLDEVLERQKQANIELIQAEANFTQAQRDNAQQRRQILQDIGEIELDVLIDGLDNVLQINERKRQDDRLTLSTRRALLEEDRENADRSFQEQIKVLQEFTDQQINANELIAETDAKRLAEQVKNIGLSEILQTRLLEVIRERRLLLQDFEESERDIFESQQERDSARLQAQLDLRQIQAENLLSQAQTQEEIDAQLDALAQVESDRRDLLLENIALTEEEKQLIIAESEQKIQDIRKNSANEQLATAEKLAEAEKNIEKSKTDFKFGLAQQLLGLTQSLGIESNALAVALGLADIGIDLAKTLTANTLAAAQIAAIAPPASLPLAATYKATADGQALATAGISAAQVVANQIAAAGGGTFVTNGETQLTVGDNPGGKELVSVVPLSGMGVTRVNGNAIQMAGGGTLIADGGLGTSTSRNNLSQEMQFANNITDAIRNMPAPVVGVREFTRVQDRVTAKEKITRIG